MARTVGAILFPPSFPIPTGAGARQCALAWRFAKVVGALALRPRCLLSATAISTSRVAGAGSRDLAVPRWNRTSPWKRLRLMRAMRSQTACRRCWTGRRGGGNEIQDRGNSTYISGGAILVILIIILLIWLL